MEKEYIQNIKVIRIEKGISQKEMALRLGYGHSNYNKIENGLIEISVSKLYEIADILEVPILKILGGKELEKFMEFIRLDYEEKMKNWFDDVAYKIKNAKPILKKEMTKEEREKITKDRFESYKK
jgi:transcriptional regulator with XRE-family HTH domain